MSRRAIRSVRIIVLLPESEHVEVVGPLSWFDAIKRVAGWLGECKAVDQLGRVFAAADDSGVRQETGDRLPIGHGVGMLTPGDAIANAERCSWRRMSSPYRDAAMRHQEKDRPQPACVRQVGAGRQGRQAAPACRVRGGGGGA